MKVNKNELITVIIPCYNVEKYISECLDSVLKQSHDNLEVIVIDDCSTDNTNKIIKTFNDQRIKHFINTKNRGVGFTRDEGVKRANGVYTLFIDPDDLYFNRGSIKYMYKKMLKGKIDVASFKSKSIYEGKQKKQSILGSISRVFFKKIQHSNWTLWNKIYKTEWLSRQPRQELRNAQDLYFAIRSNPKYKVFRKKVIYYRVNTGSLSNKKDISNQRKKDIILIGNRIIQLNNEKYHWYVIENFIVFDWFRSKEINDFIISKNYKFNIYSKIRNQKKRLKRTLTKKEA